MDESGKKTCKRVSLKKGEGKRRRGRERCQIIEFQEK